jgi:hypothetical protein
MGQVAMSTSVTEQQVSSKTALTRLLDLLAGWSTYVSADEENNVLDPALAAEEIGALYQLAGELTEKWDQLSAEGQGKAIRAFVEERILPLLLRKSQAV